MLLKLVGLCALAQVAVSQITIKDGNIGVNFGGYHAEAGLGGLITGNAAHGGLQASAGTPYGQSASAGIGGGANGAGALYAGATAGQGVDASASLNGDLNQGFGVGQASASYGGIHKEVIKTVSKVPIASTTDADDNDLSDNRVPETQYPAQPAQPSQTIATVPATVFNVQKIRVKKPVHLHQYTVPVKQFPVPEIRFQFPAPIKTFSYAPPPTLHHAAPVAAVHQYPIPSYRKFFVQKRIDVQVPYQVQQVQQVQEAPSSYIPPATTTTSTTPRPAYVYTYDKGAVINEIFNIPIQVLRSVSALVNAKLNSGFAVQKTISYA